MAYFCPPSFDLNLQAIAAGQRLHARPFSQGEPGSQEPGTTVEHGTSLFKYYLLSTTAIRVSVTKKLHTDMLTCPTPLHHITTYSNWTPADCKQASMGVIVVGSPR